MTKFSATAGPHDSVALHPVGRLNLTAAPDLRRELIELVQNGQTRLVVDLIDVDTIDSSGIGALISGLKAARQAGGDLRIVAPSKQVAEVLRMTKLERVLQTYPSVEEAFDNSV